MPPELRIPHVRVRFAFENRYLRRIPGRPPRDWNAVTDGPPINEQLHKWSVLDVAAIAGVGVFASPGRAAPSDPLAQALRVDCVIRYVGR